ncbi:MAG: phycobilisome rod-core linker polypeptide [Synechococcales cyanobacterium]
MALPLLNYAPVSQNQRVSGFEIPGEEQPRIYSMDMNVQPDEVEEVIWAAYRQVFSEHQILASNRQTILESQLRNGQISVRDFILGLATSESFKNYNYYTNNNYRFVQICVQRLLGRDVYGEDEKIAWSIVIANKGVQGFVEALVNSSEYLDAYGLYTVPYQRRRILPQRSKGEVPFNLKSPRYDEYHRNQLGFPQFSWRSQVKRFRGQETRTKAGDPSQYLGLAREVNPQQVRPPRFSVYSINIDTMVPRR